MSHANSSLIVKLKRHLPNTVLAGTDSLLSQKDTWERITVIIHGKYVWITKYPIFLLRWKCVVMTTYSPRDVEKEIWVGFFKDSTTFVNGWFIHVVLIFCYIISSTYSLSVHAAHAAIVRLNVLRMVILEWYSASVIEMFMI